MYLRILLVCFSIALGAGAESPVNLDDNAALKYWQAIALKPNVPTPDKVYSDPVGQPLSDVTRKYIRGLGDFSLSFLRKGAEIRDCAWGLSHEDGPTALLPHLAQVRALTCHAVFHFRMRCEDDIANAKVDNLQAAFTLSRHVSRDFSVCLLIGFSCERMTINNSLLFLPRLNRGELVKLASWLDRLPPEEEFDAVLRREMDDMLVHYKRFALSALGRTEKDRELITAYFDKGLDPNVDLAPDTKQKILDYITKRLRMSGQEINDVLLKQLKFEALGTMFSELRKLNGEQADILRLPLNEMAAAQEVLNVKVKASTNPMVKSLLPVSDRFPETKINHAVTFALYRAGIAVILGGQDELKKHVDPVDKKTFDYKELDTGFELFSRQRSIVNKDKPLSLRFGVAPEAVVPKQPAEATPGNIDSAPKF
jgi:hypothetical protein